MRVILSFILFCSMVFGQLGTKVSPTELPGEFPSRYGFVNGSTYYTCWAKPQPSASVLTVASVTAGASTTIAITGGHGFHSSASPRVTISGMTGDWAPLNGTWKATYVDANSVTIPVNSSGFGSVTGTISFSTFAPRLTAPIWKVFRIVVSGGVAASELWSTGDFESACTDRETLSYQ